MKFLPNKMYFTKDGRGKVQPFNIGDVIGAEYPACAILPIMETNTKGVYWDGGISRKEEHIKPTIEEAQDINY